MEINFQTKHVIWYLENEEKARYEFKAIKLRPVISLGGSN